MRGFLYRRIPPTPTLTGGKSTDDADGSQMSREQRVYCFLIFFKKKGFLKNVFFICKCVSSHGSVSPCASCGLFCCGGSDHISNGVDISCSPQSARANQLNCVNTVHRRCKYGMVLCCVVLKNMYQ